MRDGVAVPVAQAEEADLNEARAELAAGKPDQARHRLERLLQEIPDGSRKDETLLLLGDSYRELGQVDPAVATYRRLLGRRSRGPWVPLAHLRLAEIYRETGRPELARRVLARAPFNRADPSVRVRLYTMLAQLAEEAGQDRDALRWLAYARGDVVEGAEIARIDHKIEELLQRVLSDLELERLSREVPRGPVHDRLLIELAMRSLQRGDLEAAEDWIARLPDDLRPEQEEQRNRLLEQLREDVVGPGAPIGVALPLSGPYAGYGWSALRGIVLGFGTFDRSPGGFRIHLRDTEGDTDGAQRAVQALFSEGVVAVLGPLRSATAAAVAESAEEARVPLMTLARAEDLSSLGSWVFRLGVTRADQTRVLARYAIERRGARRIAILYPEDQYGIDYKNLFWDEVEQHGAEIVGVESYAPEAVDVQGPIRKLVGLEYLTPRERSLIEERDRLARRPLENEERLADPELAELPPYVDFDALFIPEAAQKAGLILPQLRFYDVRDVLLLGSSGWNDPKIVEIAGRDAEGAVFTDAFFARSEFHLVQEFASAYYAEFGEEPDALAAEGYDAASILRGILSEEASFSRTRVRDALLRVRDFRGVSGLTSFDESGGTRKSLYLLTVHRGQISELEQAR
jgi:ABC-type branched-subunit amino acid transport system substrate-binding protein/thioredoxin-like negative regulator of GroEL